MSKAIGLLAIVMLLVGLSGCSAPESMASSKLARATNPSVSQAELDAVVAGINATAFGLYQGLDEARGNFCYSPYSASRVVAMAYAGANGETEQAIAQALGFTLPQDRLHVTFNALDFRLAGYSFRSEEQGERGFGLVVAQSIWALTSSDVSRATSFLPEFLDVLAENYGAGVRYLKKRAPDESRTIVNSWLVEQTGGRLDRLIPIGAIKASTTMLLADAVLFDSPWLHPFDPTQTRDGTFNRLDGSQITVPMLEQTRAFAYAQQEQVQAVAMPYAGDQVTMVILLPEAGQFAEFASSMSIDGVDTLLANMETASVHLAMPRFDYETYVRLGSALARLGMLIGAAGADFSGMDGTTALFVDDLYHKTLMSVGEAGTGEVVAPSASAGAATSASVQVTVDRPFLFLVRDTETGLILFMGHVLDPSA
jgi:serpin B